MAHAEAARTLLEARRDGVASVMRDAVDLGLREVEAFANQE
ncbi:hypothetical protein DB30_03087 [Enhygromyxa salina]|uniref:Uncharacterized protein n=2 Tax=Enhygromyxa salina TaxID=215803 RepID=A0A0C2D2X8_9BACT|nr:hypothetical protein DB30_03087 [Enhygromyxa salina]